MYSAPALKWPWAQLFIFSGGAMWVGGAGWGESSRQHLKRPQVGQETLSPKSAALGNRLTRKFLDLLPLTWKFGPGLGPRIVSTEARLNCYH